MYTYRAIVTEVYDGDSITVDIDLGFNTWIDGMKVRLLRIDAPEMRGEEAEAGELARDYLRSLILGKTLTLTTVKDRTDKYGRYLGEIWINTQNINDEMVKAGHAIYRDY